MSQQSINSNTDLSSLLLFQDNFISTVHTHLYHKTQPFQEVFLTFQIHHVSDINDKFNNMLTTLSSQLVDNKLSYELNLRDSFQRLLQADFLPLMRINRYQLTKLSLFGFDIYVEPLEAVLQILSRLDVSKKRLLQSNTDLQQVNGAESALQKGWQVYMAYLQEWKITFNLYILQEYLRVGGKSFLKKDRQILFTGISNLHNQLVTALSQKKKLKLLKELAQLNNSLYHFHQSFNYFHFYALLLPLQTTLQPIFAFMKEIAQKCLRTNILTPLLFGILRHRESFLKFIEEADSPIWLPYLNTIVSGIAINLKFRILEYEQIMEIFERAANRAGLLGKLDTSYVFGTLQNGWKDAKQFFISAVKVGFNSGEVQIWKSVELDQIGPKVIESVIDGMLLNPLQNEQLGELIGQIEQKLEKQLLRLSDGKINRQMVTSSICQLQKSIQSQQKLLNLLRILNLQQQSDEYCLNLVITSILNANLPHKPIIQQIINKCLTKINSFLINFKGNNFSLLRHNVIAMHSNYKPQTQHKQIIDLYINNYDPKRCVSALLNILPVGQPTCRVQLIDKLTSCYFSQNSSKLVKIRTFQQELFFKNSLVNPSYQTHSVLTVLVSQLTNSESKTDVNELTKEIISRNPQLAFCLLNFPVNQLNSICSFVNYLIQNTQHHQLLKSILLSSRGAVHSQEGTDLMQALTYPNICENICKKINETEQITHMHPYLNLLLWTIQNMQRNQLLCRELLAVYLFAMEKATNQQLMQAIVSDISRLSVLAFGEKLQWWLAYLLLQRIENKYELQRVSRKKVLRNQKNSVYFINQIDEKVQQDSKQRENKKIDHAVHKEKQIDVDFWAVFDRLSQLNQEQLLSLLQNNNSIQQQSKQLLFPPISAELLKDILTSQQSIQQNRTLQIIVLNTDNYLSTINHLIAHNNFTALKTYKMIARLTSNLNDFLKVQAQHKYNFLGPMSANLSLKQRKRIAQNFYIEWSSLQHYVLHMQGIQYLTIYNAANWRILIQYLNKQFSAFKLPSLLLQYRQYLGITSQSNQQYEQSIRSQGLLFTKYVRLFIAKLQTIFDQSNSEEQIELKYAHELSSLNLVVVSLQLREIVGKLALLHGEMRDRSIVFEQYWIADVAELNIVLNRHIKGRVVLPDFTHGFMLTNDKILNKYKVEIGVFLEEYYQIMGSDVNKQRYLPTNLNKVALSEISRDAMTVIDVKSLQQPIETYQQQVLTSLIDSKCIVQMSDGWQFDFQHITKNNQHLILFYRLGCLSALQQSSSKHCSLPQFLRQILTRQKLSWQLVKPIRADQFHFIKSVLVEPEITNRQLLFVHDQEQLTADGKSIRVNDYNKLSYCQAIALKAIGQPALHCAGYFFQGFINQQSNN